MNGTHLEQARKYRSCYVDDRKCSIGDFVFVKGVGIEYSTDGSAVGCIENIFDKGSGYEDPYRVVVSVTWFLRQGDIVGLEQDYRELILDKREGNGRGLILAANILYPCQVVWFNDLAHNDKHSFFYRYSFDGKSRSVLNRDDLPFTKSTASPQSDSMRPKRVLSTRNQSHTDSLENDSLNKTLRSRKRSVSQNPSNIPDSPDSTSKENSVSKPKSIRDVRVNLRKTLLQKSPTLALKAQLATLSPMKKKIVDSDVTAELFNSDSCTGSSASKPKKSSVQNEARSHNPDRSMSPSKIVTRNSNKRKNVDAPIMTDINQVIRMSLRGKVENMNTDAVDDGKTDSRLRSAKTSTAVKEQRKRDKRNLIDSIMADLSDDASSTQSVSIEPEIIESDEKAVGKELTGKAQKLVRDPFEFFSDEEERVLKPLKSKTQSKVKTRLQESEERTPTRSTNGKSQTKPLPVLREDKKTSKTSTASLRKSVRQQLCMRIVENTPGTSKRVQNHSKRRKLLAVQENQQCSQNSSVKEQLEDSDNSESTGGIRRSSRLGDIRRSSLPDDKRRSSRLSLRKVKPQYIQSGEEDESESSDTETPFTSPLSNTPSRRTRSSKSNRETRTPRTTSRRTPSRAASSVKPQYVESGEEDESESSGTETSLSSSFSDTPSRPTRSSKSNRETRTPRTTSRHTFSSATPSVPERQKPVAVTGSELERARAQLHVSVLPDSLPCREDEFANILNYIESKIESRTGGCLYISGVPGTGKTATVYEVMRYLEQNKEEKVLPEFKFIEINGMRLTHPQQTFSHIYKALTEKKVTSDHAVTLLDKIFSRKRTQDIVILLVDELDLLVTRKQDVLYNLFDWPTKPHSKLIVLAIANTMDLPERVMINRVSSRLGLNRMTFQPYTFQQLQEIVHSRLKDIKAFDPDAIQLASRKVAAVSGDARRALDICRRSTEVAENNGGSYVTMSHVDAALNEMFSSPKIAAIRNCTSYEKIVLKSIVAEFMRSGVEEATLNQVYRHIPALCTMERVPTIKMCHMNLICSNLDNLKLILVECSGYGIHQRVRLNVSQDDVHYSLRDQVSDTK